MEHISKFAQGTIWQWTQADSVRYDEGVQAGTRPVLIISNNTFNAHSSSVNCVTITSVLKDSPVHVALHLSVMSHIQCEQVHTVPKKDLYNFKGIVSPATMEEVKAKLKFQFNMADDTHYDLLKDIDCKLQQLNDEVKMGFISSEREMYTISILKELLLNIAHMKKDFVELLQVNTASSQNISATEEILQLNRGCQIVNNGSLIPTEGSPIINDNLELTTKEEIVVTSENKRMNAKRRSINTSSRRYTDEEKAFILDENNSLETLMIKFGFKDRQSAYKTRYYFKRNS